MTLNFGNVIYPGDPFWISLLLNFFGAFFGFGFALFIYYKTLKDDKRKESLKSDSERADELTYFQNLLDGSISHIENLFADLTTYVVMQRQDLLDLQTLKFKVNNDINRINKQDSLNIFLAYRHYMSKEKTWIHDYRKIYNSIDLITETEVEIKRIYQYNMQDSYRKGMKIKELIDSIPNKLATYAFPIAEKLGEKRFDNVEYKFLDDKIGVYQSLVNEEASLSEFESYYLEPLIKELLANYKDQIFAHELILLCRNTRTLMNDLRLDLNSYLQELEQIPSKSKNYIQLIKDESARIKNTLLKIS